MSDAAFEQVIFTVLGDKRPTSAGKASFEARVRVLGAYNCRGYRSANEIVVPFKYEGNKNFASTLSRAEERLEMEYD